MIWLAVALAAGAGATLRFLVDFAVTARSAGTMPWGTLVVNASGSLAIGGVAGLVVAGVLEPGTGTVLAGGFCGAYTTFSTFAWETLRLAEEGARARAIANVLGNLVLGVAAAAVGYRAVVGL